MESWKERVYVPEAPKSKVPFWALFIASGLFLWILVGMALALSVGVVAGFTLAPLFLLLFGSSLYKLVK